MLSSIMASGIALTFLPAAQQSDDPHKELIRTIVAAWNKKAAQIRSFTCAAKVETFYPTGSLSERCQGRRKDYVYPTEDQVFRGGTSFLAVDFAGPRIRKEFKYAQPFFFDNPRGEEEVELGLDSVLRLFSDGKFREFRQREGHPEKIKEDVFPADVILYESVSHDFLLNLLDLPLL